MFEASRIVKENKRQEKAEKKAELQMWLSRGVVFHTIRPNRLTQTGGGMVVAEIRNSKGSHLAFAFCNKTDEFRKLDGKLLAAYRLETGDSMFIPKGQGMLFAEFAAENFGFNQASWV